MRLTGMRNLRRTSLVFTKFAYVAYSLTRAWDVWRDGAGSQPKPISSHESRWEGVRCPLMNASKQSTHMGSWSFAARALRGQCSFR